MITSYSILLENHTNESSNMVLNCFFFDFKTWLGFKHVKRLLAYLLRMHWTKKVVQNRIFEGIFSPQRFLSYGKEKIDNKSIISPFSIVIHTTTSSGCHEM